MPSITARDFISPSPYSFHLWYVHAFVANCARRSCIDYCCLYIYSTTEVFVGLPAMLFLVYFVHMLKHSMGSIRVADTPSRFPLSFLRPRVDLPPKIILLLFPIPLNLILTPFLLFIEHHPMQPLPLRANKGGPFPFFP